MAVINAVSLSELSALRERLAGIKGLARDAHKLQLSEHAVRFRRAVPLERVIENTRFRAFPYQFELFNQPF